MLNSRIYSKYFPVRSAATQFDEAEKQILRNWVNRFRTDVWTREIEKHKHGYADITTYNLAGYDESTMVDMINMNRFDDKNLAWLNIIMYRHKYNAVLSMWIFPMLTDTNSRKILFRSKKMKNK